MRHTPSELVTKQSEIMLNRLGNNLTYYQGEGLGAVRNAVSAVSAIVAKFSEKAQSVHDNKELTLLGQQKRLKELGQQTLQELNAAETTRMAGFGVSIDELARELQPAPARTLDPVTAVRREMRMQELRADLRSIDPLELNALYKTTDDPDVLEAVEQAPPVVRVVTQQGGFRDVQVVPLVSPDTIAQRRRDLGAAAKPEAAGRLAEVEEMRAAVAGLIGSARQEIAKAANLPDERQPIAAA